MEHTHFTELGKATSLSRETLNPVILETLYKQIILVKTTLQAKFNNCIYFFTKIMYSENPPFSMKFNKDKLNVLSI